MVGTAIGAAALATRRRSALGGAQSIREQAEDYLGERAFQFVEPELDEAERRARAAGAQGELEFVGAGMTGIVMCDATGHAFKVSRRAIARPKQDTGVVAEEAAWLQQAAKLPEVAKHVARGVRYDAHNHVLVRECLVPRKSRERHRINETRLRALHDRIGAAMRQQGWSAPEYKPDSYVYTRDRGPVLVDAGFAHRDGAALVRDVLDALNNRRALEWRESPVNLAWQLRMERDKSIPAPVANKLLKRLQALDPAVEL